MFDANLFIPLFDYIKIGILAFFISLLLTPLIKRFAIHFNVTDNPDFKRKIHTVPHPVLGGVAIFFSFAVCLTAGYMLNEEFRLVFSGKNFAGLLFGSALIVLLGLLDDIYHSSAHLKFIMQLFPATILFLYGFKIDLITNPFGGSIEISAPLSYLITIFWILSLTNAVNLIDGMDGLATGITVIAALTLFVVALNRQSEDINSAFLTIIIFGAGLGFIKFNWPPAQIFLGDCGSLLLGFLLSAVGIIGINKATTAVALMVPISAIGIPIYDTIIAILRRTKRGQKIFSPDAEHIHHRLLKIGLSKRQAVLLLYAISIYFSIVAFAFIKVSKELSLLLLIFFLLSIFTLASYIRKKEIKLTIRKKEQRITD